MAVWCVRGLMQQSVYLGGEAAVDKHTIGLVLNPPLRRNLILRRNHLYRATVTSIFLVPGVVRQVLLQC